MSKPFNDPSLLTKDRLKKELERNGVKLPRGEQKKDVYVKLYQENLSPRSDRRLGNGEFSSDDDYDDSDKQIVPRTSRTASKVGSKEIISPEIKNMTDEELKEEFSDLGQPVGPILPSTRGLYERKLANLYATSPNNTGTIVTVTNSEFSDNDFGEEQEPEEESIPNDEFFNGDQNRRGDNFGSNFSKNFENSSSKKEVTRDFSVSSSRNVERSSTFDRKTINKVRSKKGDKFEEKSWSSTSDNQNDENDDGVDMNSLPPSIQKAITAARRLTPEKENGTGGLRERSSWQPKPEVVPKTETENNVDEKPMTQDEKKKSQTSSRRWWRLLVVLIVLIALVAAVAYNFEYLPNIKQSLDAHVLPQPSIMSKNKTS